MNDKPLVCGILFFMGVKIELKGKRFGKLLVTGYSHTLNNRAFWFVKCDCGIETVKMGRYLLNGDTSSCGCILAKDGRTKTRPYKIWASMMTRCYNKNRRSYKNYGGKGIRVCDRWHDFKNFYEDTKHGYRDDLTLDRYPNRNGNYEPGNTRWANTQEQARNKDRTIEYMYDGRKMIVPEIAKETGLSPFTIYSRLSRGLPPEEAFKAKNKTIADLAKQYGISYDKLHHRLVNLKLSIEDAVSLTENQIRYAQIHTR